MKAIDGHGRGISDTDIIIINLCKNARMIYFQLLIKIHVRLGVNLLNAD